jgi:hypothetical protein
LRTSTGGFASPDAKASIPKNNSFGGLSGKFPLFTLLSGRPGAGAKFTR